MSAKKYLYNYDKQLESYKKRLSKSKKISKRNKDIIEKYIRDNKLKAKLELPTLLKYYDILVTVATKYTKKDFDKLEKEDFEKIIEQVNSREDITVSTKAKYWSIMKKFGNWLVNGDKIFNGNGFVSYPETVVWINTTIKAKDKNKIKASNILTEEEIDRLISSANSVRDKAFLSCLYETGARISELGNIRIRDISETDGGYLIDLAQGKTGERNVIIVFSSAKIVQWLNQHPDRENKDASVWVCTMEDNNNKKRIGEPLGYGGLKKIVERAKKRAKIDKRTYPHLFRHSRVTHLLVNKQLNEQQAKVYFGWCPSSKMLANYSHLTSSDVNRTMLQINGIKPTEKIVDGKKARVCPHCNKPNDPKDKFCGFCSKPLDFKTVMELENKNKVADKVIRKAKSIDRSILKETIREMIKAGELML